MSSGNVRSPSHAMLIDMGSTNVEPMARAHSSPASSLRRYPLSTISKSKELWLSLYLFAIALSASGSIFSVSSTSETNFSALISRIVFVQIENFSDRVLVDQLA